MKSHMTELQKNPPLSSPGAETKALKSQVKSMDGFEEEMSGRERLKRHRIEVASRVWIPDIWGQEELLKDWMDCSAFDDSLVPNGIVSARSALVEEARRKANSHHGHGHGHGLLPIENSC